MRQLHVVERDADAGRVVLATTDGLERFELAVDQTLRDAVTDTPPRPVGRHAHGDARITPREVQMRVRAGASAQELADTHDADLEWVMRFATPVLAERTRIADEARRARARRSTTEGQTVVFGETVDQRFAAHGIDPGDVAWDAHRREDGQWVVVARWIGGQSEHSAQWGFQLSGRQVAPLDDTAADLLSDRPIRPLFAETTPTSPPALTLAPPLAPGVVAFPVMPDANTGPLPRTDEVFDQEQFAEDTALPAFADRPAAATPAAPSSASPVPPTAQPAVPPTPSAPAVPSAPERDIVPEREPAAVTAAAPSFDEPLLPMHVEGAPSETTRIPRIRAGREGRTAESEDEKAARAAIPSWDDILLGVRRKRD